AGLENLEFYKFAYSENVYTNSYNISNGNTQFSIFVTDNGKIIIPAVVYVNNIPVWIQQASGQNPYSINIIGGYNKIKLRTADREITLDSIYISPFRKNIIAVPKDIQTKLYRSERREKLFSPSEINQLSRYIMPYKNNFSSSAAYIINRGR